mmetsp:Transcript_118532/g.340355  ORF Transcript_118532/g.340355 Transcript_118532/m.340355 type:complete len:215 (-) Transcript_118532:543-1187(-)
MESMYGGHWPSQRPNAMRRTMIVVSWVAHSASLGPAPAACCFAKSASSKRLGAANNRMPWGSVVYLSWNKRRATCKVSLKNGESGCSSSGNLSCCWPEHFATSKQSLKAGSNSVPAARAQRATKSGNTIRAASEFVYALECRSPAARGHGWFKSQWSLDSGLVKTFPGSETAPAAPPPKRKSCNMKSVAMVRILSVDARRVLFGVGAPPRKRWK